ncbi:hypothetical protein G6M89_08545 [Natronolimnobius sp. AArcel1]|uniref:hypothetical protein n=1 Tax=Natronolimnobius sp. AArcel1 TaxID=1679093 RepID=UPI0013ED2AF2|nr:hypothetical protein [Natronolimnobius sp. AArcel1]NGM69057.1 hypothetical protein [Natronolimnobius sp. AArcel1]
MDAEDEPVREVYGKIFAPHDEYEVIIQDQTVAGNTLEVTIGIGEVTDNGDGCGGDPVRYDYYFAGIESQDFEVITFHLDDALGTHESVFTC